MLLWFILQHVAIHSGTCFFFRSPRGDNGRQMGKVVEAHLGTLIFFCPFLQWVACLLLTSKEGSNFSPHTKACDHYPLPLSLHLSLRRTFRHKDAGNACLLFPTWWSLMTGYFSVCLPLGDCFCFLLWALYISLFGLAFQLSRRHTLLINPKIISSWLACWWPPEPGCQLN